MYNYLNDKKKLNNIYKKLNIKLIFLIIYNNKNILNFIKKYKNI